MSTTPLYDQTLATWPARDRDPATSHAAVPDKPSVALVQTRVLSILDQHGPCTHDEIHDHYVLRYGPVSPQNTRSRTSELHKTWRVIAQDRKGRTTSGRTAVRWALRREEHP